MIAVIGLDDRRFGGPAGVGSGDPPGAQYLFPSASPGSNPPGVAQLYNFPTNPGAGQTVGLFEAGDAGAGYLQSDIALCLQAAFPGAPFPLPNFNDIGLLGQVNNTGNVTPPPPPPNPAYGAVFECTLDVSVVAAAAPGCNINVYFTTNNELGWKAFFHRAFHPIAGEPGPSVLSSLARLPKR